jgi:Flp pilus assembly protein TadG
MSATHNKRRGSILVLSAFLMVIMLGMIAFALDVGVMMLTKTQLQVAADAAAMAAGAVLGAPDSDPAGVAKQFAALHKANGKNIALADADIQNGTWDATTRTFTPTDEVSNAIKITARANESSGGNGLYFARIFGVNTMSMSASAVAMGNPRDICFVVDLSGSMNNDTEPAWKTAEINSQFGGGLGNTMMQQVFTDMGYGTFPGVLQHVGQPLGVTQDSRAYARLTANNGPLRNNGIHSNYRINTNDNENTRKQKAYRWMIDNQIAVTMPGVQPPANWSTHYNYWAAYLDYIMSRVTVNSGAGTPPSNRGTLPPNQNGDRMSSMNSGSSSYNDKIGYLTYVQFMGDMGRDERPDGVNYTPMAVSSPNCIRHMEQVGNTSFNFPASEQPLHATRRAMIAAMQIVAERNASVPDSNLRDWVSVVTFDTTDGTVLALPLTSDYSSAMNFCRDMQCVYDGMLSTSTETGLIAARNHIKPSNQGGAGRLYTNKVVVLATDGVANLKTSSNNTISSFRSSNPNGDWYGDDPESDAALMQSAMMQGDKWRVFSIAFGSGADFGFMDRLARMGGTADDEGLAPRTSGNPALIEGELSNIFHQIITTPAVRLVQ